MWEEGLEGGEQDRTSSAGSESFRQTVFPRRQRFLDTSFTASEAQIQTQGKFRINAWSQGATSEAGGVREGQAHRRLVGKGESLGLLHQAELQRVPREG